MSHLMNNQVNEAAEKQELNENDKPSQRGASRDLNFMSGAYSYPSYRPSLLIPPDLNSDRRIPFPKYNNNLNMSLRQNQKKMHTEKSPNVALNYMDSKGSKKMGTNFRSLRNFNQQQSDIYQSHPYFSSQSNKSNKALVKQYSDSERVQKVHPYKAFRHYESNSSLIKENLQSNNFPNLSEKSKKQEKTTSKKGKIPSNIRIQNFPRKLKINPLASINTKNFQNMQKLREIQKYQKISKNNPKILKIPKIAKKGQQMSKIPKTLKSFKNQRPQKINKNTQKLSKIIMKSPKNKKNVKKPTKIVRKPQKIIKTIKSLPKTNPLLNYETKDFALIKMQPDFNLDNRTVSNKQGKIYGSEDFLKNRTDYMQVEKKRENQMKRNFRFNSSFEEELGFNGGKSVKVEKNYARRREFRSPRGRGSRYLKSRSIKRKRANKKLAGFSTEELLKQERLLEIALHNLQKDSGKLIKPVEKDVIPKNTLWNAMLREMKVYQEDFHANLNRHRRLMLSLCKSIETYHETKLRKKKKSVVDATRKSRRKAKEICTLVRRGFWAKINKLQAIKTNWKEQEMQRNIFKERLDTFVEESSSLSKRLAEKLVNTAEEKNTKIPSKNENEEDPKFQKPKPPSETKISQTTLKIPVPPLLRFGTLRDYQRIGLDWLVALHESKLNGILADEMGLGKTVQTIALLAHLATAEENWGPHLLVVPTSVVVNWEIEFKRWLPGFKVLAYYGSSKERKAKRKSWDLAGKSNRGSKGSQGGSYEKEGSGYNVLVTSYHLAVADNKVLKRKKWEYLILDEAHNIKNFQSKKWQALMGFKTNDRLLLTGTPLQNNIMELWAFLHFLMPQKFASRLEFTQWFDSPIGEIARRNQTLANAPIVRSLHSVLRPFMLRRLKKDVAQQLPRKRELLIKCRLSLRQRRLYEDFMAETTTRDIMSRENLSGMWGVLMQLRKVCNHPDLFEARPIISPLALPPLAVRKPPAFFKGLIGLYRMPFDRVCMEFLNIGGFDGPTTVSAESVRRLKTEEKKFRVLFSHENREKNREKEDNASSKDIPTKNRLLVGSCKELSQALSNDFVRRRLIWLGTENAPKESKNEKKWSLKSKVNAKKCDKPIIYGENLIRFFYLGKTIIKARQKLTPLRSAIKLPADRSEQLKDTVSNFVFVNAPAIAPEADPSENLLSREDALQSQNTVNNGKIREKSSGKSNFSNNERKNGAKSVVSSLQWDRSVHKELSNEIDDLTEPFHLSHIRSRMNFPDKRLIQWDCGKLQKLSELLQEHKKKGDRCLIFTQMAKMLDVLEAFLNVYGYRYFRLDGSTKADRRGALMERFNRDTSVFVFILTTRSGGYGINLTGANVVFFYDTDWNPQIDMQAQDRAHRIGQTREVTIYRLISTNTVEENMFSVSLNKRKITAAVIGDGKFNTKNLIKRSDICMMLGLTWIEKKQDEAKEKSEDEEDSIVEMMKAAEDEEDQRNLKSAMTELKEAGLTAEENTAQMEAELRAIERYALNLDSYWVNMVAFPEARCDYESEDCGSEEDKNNEENCEKGEIKDNKENEKMTKNVVKKDGSIIKEADTGNSCKRKRDESKTVEKLEDWEEIIIKQEKVKISGNESAPEIKTRKEKNRLPKELLGKKFAALSGYEQRRLLSFFRSLFSRQGYYVHPDVIDNRYQGFSSLTSESFLTLKQDLEAQKPKAAKKLQELAAFNLNSIKEEEGEVETEKYERKPKSIIKIDDLKCSFCLNDPLLKLRAFGNLFPAEENIHKLSEKVTLQDRPMDLEDRMAFEYHWASCPDQPKIKLSYKNPKKIECQKLNSPVNIETGEHSVPKELKPYPDAYKNTDKKKNTVMKKRIRKNKSGTVRIRKPLIFAREVIIKIPFKYLRARMPRGFRAWKAERARISKSVITTIPLNTIMKRTKKTEGFNFGLNSGIKRELEHKVPIQWTRKEDAILIKIAKFFDRNWEVVQCALADHPLTSGHLRSRRECKSRFFYLCESPIKVKHRSQEGIKAIKLYEMREAHLQATTKKCFSSGGAFSDPKNVLTHYPVSLGTPEIVQHLRSAFQSVSSHREACKNALTDTLKVGQKEAMHYSHAAVVAGAKELFGLNKNEDLPPLKKIAELAYKKTAPNENSSLSNHEVKNILSNFSPSVTELQKEMKNTALRLCKNEIQTTEKKSVAGFINYVVGVTPGLKEKLKEMCFNKVPSYEKIRAVAIYYLQHLKAIGG